MGKFSCPLCDDGLTLEGHIEHFRKQIQGQAKVLDFAANVEDIGRGDQGWAEVRALAKQWSADLPEPVDPTSADFQAGVLMAAHIVSRMLTKLATPEALLVIHTAMTAPTLWPSLQQAFSETEGTDG